MNNRIHEPRPHTTCGWPAGQFAKPGWIAAMLFCVITCTAVVPLHGQATQNPLRGRFEAIPVFNPVSPDPNPGQVADSQHEQPLEQRSAEVVQASYLPMRHEIRDVSVQKIPIHPQQRWDEAAQLPTEEHSDPSSDVLDQDSSLNTVRLRASGEPLGEQNTTKSFQSLVAKLAINCALVMVLAVGFVVAGRRWLKKQRPVSLANREQPGMEIRATLRIGPKTQLHLVAVDRHQVLVACDAEGVKSMTPLGPSFSGIFEDLGEDPSPSGATEHVGTEHVRTEHVSTSIKDYLATYIANAADPV